MKDKNLILNPIFLSCLVILFLNDHFFKFYYTSWFTGKLSDIVGIILLPMLLTYLFPKLKQNSVFAAGILFTFWKSPLSESFITIYNTISPISTSRIVDYTDLWVLLLLPIPYFLIKNKRLIKDLSIKQLNPLVVLVPTVFVLMSTAPPASLRYYNYVPYTGNLNFDNASFELDKTQENLISELTKRNISIHKDTVRIIDLKKDAVLRIGAVKHKNWNNNEPVFKIDNDSLKQVFLRAIETSNSYKIDKIQLDDQVIEDIQFEMFKINEGKSTQINIHSIKIERYLREDKVERKLQKVYKKLLIEKFQRF